MSATGISKSKFSVIFDSGASMAISGCKEDFGSDQIKPLPSPLKLGGLENGMTIAGTGMVNWSFVTGKN